MKKCLTVLIYIFTIIFFSSSVFAEATSVTLNVGRDASGNFYRYEFNDGKGFTTNVPNYEDSVDFAIFNFDEGISWKLLFDGTEIEYGTGEVLVDDGKYVLIVYEDNEFAYCNFLINNTMLAADESLENMNEDELLEALLQELKKEDPETFGGIDSLDDIKYTASEQRDVDDYVNSEEFMKDIYSSLFGENGDDKNALAAMLLGEEIDNAPLNLEYDNELSMYVYRMPNGAEFYSSVPNNAITQYGVQVFFRDDASAKILDLQTGEEADYESGEIVSREGYYEIVITQSPVMDDDLIERSILLDDYSDEAIPDVDSNTYIARYFFTILRKPTGKLEIVNAPNDFKLLKVSKSGKEMEFQNDDMYIMNEDGVYEFTFSSEAVGNVTYTFSAERDTKKPKLNISEGALQGTTSKSVEWTADNASDAVKVTYNNAEVKFPENKVSGYGSYKVEVTNEAGNVQEYNFTIIPAYNSNSLVAVILLSVLAVVVVGYLLYSKRDTEVL